jgi:hypothetical protein
MAISLASQIDSTVTVITVRGTVTDASGPGVLTIDSEQIAYVGVSTDQFFELTRGYNGTTAAAHLGGAQVTYVDTPDVSPVMTSTTVNGHPLSSNVVVTKSDVGLSNVTNVIPVPTSTTVNGHALSANVTVTKSDIGLTNVPDTDCSTTVNITDSLDKRFVTDAQRSQIGSGGGALFPIGSIVKSPSAPTGNGTWLPCDGSSVSQSTYAALFSLLGHGHMEFTPTPSPSVVLSGPGNVIWTGSKWGVTSANPNLYYSSSDGTTWASVSMPNTTKSLTYCSASNTILSYIVTSTTANISTNGGASFVTHTLPIAPGNSINAIAPGNSTTSFLFINGNSRTVYTMASGGTTWTTTTNALPFVTATPRSLWWNGSVWTALMSSATFQTSDPAGITGWASITCPGGAFGATLTGGGVSINGSTVLLVQAAVSVISTDCGVTITSYTQSPLRISGSSGLGWNGYCYVLRSGAAAVNNYLTSVDGKSFASTNQGAGALVQGGTSGFFAPDSYPTTNSNMDTATGRFVDLYAPAINGVGIPFSPALMTPTPNPATQFSLPMLSDSYIKVL